MNTDHTAKFESATLILRLFELRREEKMRKARDWFGQFFPESVQDIIDAGRSENNAYYRMVTSYWDLAASLVNNGAIDEQMFNDANGEHIFVLAKMAPFLEEYRKFTNRPKFLAQVETLVRRIPNADELLRTTRESTKKMIEARRAAAAAAKS
jgi:hypothetical protein